MLSSKDNRIVRVVLFVLCGVLCSVTIVHSKVKIGYVEYCDLATPSPYPGVVARGPALVWADTIEAPGALFIKPHFANFLKG